MVFAHYLENCLSQSFYISHDDCFCENKSLDNFKFTRLKIKVPWVTFDQLCKQFSTEHQTTIDYKA